MRGNEKNYGLFHYPFPARLCVFINHVISNTGFESPCSTKGESYRFSPLETPPALCPPQKAGFTLNQDLREITASDASKNVGKEISVRTCRQHNL